MFTHKMDPLCKAEFGRRDAEIAYLRGALDRSDERVRKLESDLATIEAKLDHLLAKPEDCSIPENEAKPEALAIAPGHIPWSKRKKAREQKAKSSAFIEQIVKGAAVTDKEQSGGN